MGELSSQTSENCLGNLISIISSNFPFIFSPDITTFLQRAEEEKRARQHGAAQDNRSFFAKYVSFYCMFILFII